MSKRVPHCNDCEHLKCVDVAFKQYYCNHSEYSPT